MISTVTLEKMAVCVVVVVIDAVDDDVDVLLSVTVVCVDPVMVVSDAVVEDMLSDDELELVVDVVVVLEVTVVLVSVV
jgi:hypothetical protein